MENFETPPLTQYCNLMFEWQCLGLTIDTAPKHQQDLLSALREKILTQSGLTDNELALISLCRKHRVL